MLLEVTCGEERINLEIREEGGKETVWVDGNRKTFEVERLPAGRYLLKTESAVYDFSVEVKGDQYLVGCRDGVFPLSLRDARFAEAGQVSLQNQSGIRRIMAEMPGKVIRLLVSVGEKVTLNQPLLVIEAMKMQNEIRSLKDGVVREIGAEEGKAVNSAEFLISIE